MIFPESAKLKFEIENSGNFQREIDESRNFQKQQQAIELDSNFKKEKSIQSTAQNLKKKVLKLIGQQNRAEMCLYPINSEKQCKTYKDVDAAAKAACDLTG